MAIYDIITTAQFAEKLALFIPPYAIFRVTAITANEQMGVTFSLSSSEADAAAMFLIQEGYAIARFDISATDRLITLTDRGRCLQQAGSIPNLIEQEKKQENQRLNRERIIHLGYTLAPWIAFAAFCQGAHDLIEITRNYYTTYLVYLIDYILPYFFLLGVGILLWKLLLQPRIRTNKRKYPKM